MVRLNLDCRWQTPGESLVWVASVPRGMSDCSRLVVYEQALTQSKTISSLNATHTRIPLCHEAAIGASWRSVEKRLRFRMSASGNRAALERLPAPEQYRRLRCHVGLSVLSSWSFSGRKPQIFACGCCLRRCDGRGYEQSRTGSCVSSLLAPRPSRITVPGIPREANKNALLGDC